MYYVQDLHNGYYLEMYQGMSEYASSFGYVFIIGGYFDIKKIAELMVDGIILSSEAYSVQNIIDSITVPVVTASYESPILFNVKRVEVSIRNAIDLAISHLRSKGYQKIAFATTYINNNWDMRLRRYIELLTPVLGTRIDQYIFGTEIFEDKFQEINFYKAGYQCAEQFVRRDCQATAILCFNDDMAIGLMGCLSKHGLLVPKDIAVMGIDGHRGGIYSNPPLTTVSLNPNNHGKACAKLLIDLIENNPIEELDIIPVKVIERASV